MHYSAKAREGENRDEPRARQDARIANCNAFLCGQSWAISIVVMAMRIVIRMRQKLLIRLDQLGRKRHVELGVAKTGVQDFPDAGPGS